MLESNRSGDVLVFEELKGGESRRQLAAVFPQGMDADEKTEKFLVEMLMGRMKTVGRRDQNKLAEGFYAGASIQSLKELLGPGFDVKGKSWTEAKTSSGPMSAHCWLVQTPWGLAWLSRLSLLALDQARMSPMPDADLEDHRTMSSIDADQKP